MDHDFEQVEWDAELASRCRHLAELAREEDFDGGIDHTAAATVGEDALGAAAVVAREDGVIAGVHALPAVIDVFAARVSIDSLVQDGQGVAKNAVVARLRGSVRDLLAIERTALNFLGKLSGIATGVRRHVEVVAGTGVRIYDTRKTTPGWRKLEKYAVRCGGGHNHRSGLSAGILVKDNHIAAQNKHPATDPNLSLSALVQSARRYADQDAETGGSVPLIVEVEIDSLDQLPHVLAGRPDLVLLDNMHADLLRQAVALRNRMAPSVELEASGGITLATLKEIAETGIERISLGALTHQAHWLDFGLDWEESSRSMELEGSFRPSSPGV